MAGILVKHVDHIPYQVTLREVLTRCNDLAHPRRSDSFRHYRCKDMRSECKSVFRVIYKSS